MNKPKTEIEQVVDYINQRMADQIDKEVMNSLNPKTACTNSVWVEESGSLTMEKFIECVDKLKQDFPVEFRKYELRTKLKELEFPLLYGNLNLK